MLPMNNTNPNPNSNPNPNNPTNPNSNATSRVYVDNFWAHMFHPFVGRLNPTQYVIVEPPFPTFHRGAGYAPDAYYFVWWVALNRTFRMLRQENPISRVPRTRQRDRVFWLGQSPEYPFPEIFVTQTHNFPNWFRHFLSRHGAGDEFAATTPATDINDVVAQAEAAHGDYFYQPVFGEDRLSQALMQLPGLLINILPVMTVVAPPPPQQQQQPVIDEEHELPPLTFHEVATPTAGPPSFQHQPTVAAASEQFVPAAAAELPEEEQQGGVDQLPPTKRVRKEE